MTATPHRIDGLQKLQQTDLGNLDDLAQHVWACSRALVDPHLDRQNGAWKKDFLLLTVYVSAPACPLVCCRTAVSAPPWHWVKNHGAA